VRRCEEGSGYAHRPLLSLVVLALTMSACEAVGTIFEAGVWAGVILVVGVVAVVGFIAAKLLR
jgi:hypothetical protein